MQNWALKKIIYHICSFDTRARSQIHSRYFLTFRHVAMAQLTVFLSKWFCLNQYCHLFQNYNVIMKKISLLDSYPPSFYKLSQHNYNTDILFPYHSPHFFLGWWQWSLRCYEFSFRILSLKNISLSFQTNNGYIRIDLNNVQGIYLIAEVFMYPSKFIMLFMWKVNNKIVFPFIWNQKINAFDRLD